MKHLKQNSYLLWLQKWTERCGHTSYLSAEDCEGFAAVLGPVWMLQMQGSDHAEGKLQALSSE